MDLLDLARVHDNVALHRVFQELTSDRVHALLKFLEARIERGHYARTEGYQERHRAMLDLARFTTIYVDLCEVRAGWVVLMEATI